MRSYRQIASAMTVLGFMLAPASAQEKPGLSLELNGLSDVEQGCRFTFVSSNGLSADIEDVSVEFAFFNADGLVERLTALNFGKLPNGKTTVRQFEIPGAKCDGYSRLLVNTVKSCEGPSGGVEACEAALLTSNKSKIEFGA